MRCANTHAARGSRPFRIISMPRHIWPEDQALVTRPRSTSTSTRKCPSMRVMGSITTRVISISDSCARASRCWRVQHREQFDEGEVLQNLQPGDARRHQQLRPRREGLIAINDRRVASQGTIDELHYT